MSKLLIQESPLTFQPSLAVAIGINEAIVLQQVHYWINNSKNKGYEQDGFKWVYNTYAEWKETNFPFWSENTIQRTFASLEEKGLIVSIQPMRGKYDRTKYYRIDHTKMELFEDTKLVRSLDESENTTENTKEEPKNGVPPNYSIEWQVASGADKLHATDENHAKRVDFSNLVSQYTPNPPMAFAIAMAFQEQRGVTLPESKVKAQRKAIKEMLEMGVTGDHVRRATRQLMEKKMTVIDLFSVSKTAQDIANKPAEIVEYTRML